MSLMKTLPLLKQEKTEQAEREDEKRLLLMRRLGIEVFPAHETLTIPLERIVVPQATLIRPSPRLVRSVEHVGILQNPSVVVREGRGLHDPEAIFEVIFGRRRILAAGIVGRQFVKCEVYETITPQLSSLLALMENEQRSQAWIKEVSDLRRLIDERVGMTLSDLRAFGFDRGMLTEQLKIAQLPSSLLIPILAGQVTQAAARKLTRLTPTQLQKVEGLVQQGEQLTEDLIKHMLRLQVNAGFVPLQLVENPSQDNGEGQEPQRSSQEEEQFPSLQSVLTMLRAFERRLSAASSTHNLCLLARALIQECEVAARRDPALLAESQGGM